MTLATVLLAEAGSGERRALGLERLACDLEREAADLAGRLDGVLRSFTGAVWRGPAADRARDGLRVGQARLWSAADELRQVAALVRRRAGDARAASTALRRHAGLSEAESVRQGTLPLPA